jgi:large subunit ribosomal protein L17
MKHKIKGRKLNRNSAHRKALMRNLSIALLGNERIRTTLPKAKELRPFVEKLLTIAKKDNLANRRLAISILGNKLAVEKLFKEIAPRISSRNGGYTRIMKHGFRVGDKAPMAIMELVDRIEIVKNIEKIVEQKTA